MDGLDRRSLLQLGGAGIALGTIGRVSNVIPVHLSGQRHRTQLVASHLLHTIETGDMATIWSLFAEGGVVEFPFAGLRFIDFASLDAAVSPLLAQLPNLKFTDPAFVPLADPNGVIAKYKGHATVTSTGKAYDQTYISEIHVHRDKVASYTEYLDMAVLNEAFTP
jgi:ketosteroid isomerase-like protein